MCEYVLQMAIRTSDGDVWVERPIILPAELPISRVAFIDAPQLDGRMPVAGVGWDMTRKVYIIVAGAGAVAEAYNCEEWLVEHPGWTLRKDPE